MSAAPNGARAATGAVNLLAAGRHLTLIDESAESFTFQTFDDNRDRKDQRLARVLHGTLAANAPTLIDLSARGAGVFVTVNETDGRGRKAENVTRVRAVTCDTDGAPFDPIMRCGLEPSFVVESSPGRWHFYWLTDDLTLDEFGVVQAAIAARFGSDPNITGLPGVLRLAGFPHRKSAPFAVRVIHESGALPHSAGAIRAAFPVGERAPTKPTLAANDSKSALVVDSGTIADLRSALAHLRADGRKLWIGVAHDLHELGDVGRGLWIAWSQTSAEWQPGDAQEWDTIKSSRSGYRNVFARAAAAGWSNTMAGSAPTPARKAIPAAIASAPIVKNAAELMRHTFSPVQWALRAILPEGISILSGDPKLGKSWLTLQAGIAIAEARPLWAGREAEAAGDVLLIALEDNDRRMQRRIDKLSHYFSDTYPKANGARGAQFIGPSLARLHYATEWPRAEAGIAQIAEWLRGQPGARLVVVDTLAAFRNNDPGRKSAYAHDYEVGEMFKPLPREFPGVAFVLVMHNRKQAAADALQSVSGTQGMTGGVDNVLVLRRERGALDAGLYVDGRDIEEPQEIALRFDDGHWSSTGQSVDEARQSKERRRVLDVVTQLGAEAKARAIADAMHPTKYGAVRKMLTVMCRAGELKNDEGVYVPTHTQ